MYCTCLHDKEGKANIHVYTQSSQLVLVKKKPDRPVCVLCCVGASDSGKSTEGDRGENAAEPPPTSPVLAQYLAEARKKVEELREKTGQWSRKLTQVHQLTMHTAVSRKDNDSPAAVTSLYIAR